MTDPVMTKYGHLFEKSAIEDWVKKHKKCPLTDQPLTLQEIFPAFAVKGAIMEYQKKLKNSEILKSKQEDI